MKTQQATTPIIEEITSTASLERLRPEWLQLWRRAGEATPFQSPQWLIPWWRHIGQGQLRALALRAEDGLVGFVPLYIYRKPGSERREVFPLGIATTDYLDGLFAPGWEGAASAAALAYLDSHRSSWDVIDMPQLRSGSPLLDAEAPEGWRQQVTAAEPCPVLTLPSCLDAMHECVPGQMLHNLRYYERRAGRAGQMRVEMAEERNLEEVFEALLCLQRQRWSARGLPGVMDDPAVEGCHREMLPQLLEAGILRMLAIRLDGRIVAVFYGVADPGAGGRVYYYLGGFDPEFDRLSVGTLAIGHAVQQAVREGAAEFDFLRGNESYKYLWGARDRATYRRRLWHPDAS